MAFASSGQPKTSQPKGEVGTIGSRSDGNIFNSKKPQQDFDRQQKLATAGDTIPIVFANRANDLGGVWVQPSLLKTGSADFVGTFLYAISQGEMVDDPETFRTFVGAKNLAFYPGANATVGHHYSTAAAMAANPNVCPINSDVVYCDRDSHIWIWYLVGPNGWIKYWEPDESAMWKQFRERTEGVGDTTNTVMTMAGSDLVVREVETNTDRTANFWSIFGGGTNPATFTFNFNAVTSGGVITGGRAVGTIVELFDIDVWIESDDVAGTGDHFQALYGTTNPCIEIYQNLTVNNQINTSNPASTGTFYGIINERGAAPLDPLDGYPTTYDFSVYGDITFLLVTGNIFDPPSTGVWPITTRQLSVFYEQGVEVDLYSAGLSGGVYTRGASYQFVDLAMYLFTLIGRAEGAATADIAMPIDVSNLQALATYCTNNGTRFNGIIEQSVNVIDYISKVAPYFLLSFISANGRYSLQSLLPRTGTNTIDVSALTPAATFTETNILPGSFNKTYFDADERREINISLLWREVTPFEIGTQRATVIRFATTGNDEPAEQFDMTDFCATQAHAEIFGKYQLAKRRHSTHTISFQTPLLTTGLIPTQIIRVTRQRENSDGDDRSETNWYQITRIGHSTDGTSTVEAMHFPVDGSNISRIANEVVNGTFEVI